MSADLRALLARGAPFLDVRAPGEAARGSLPTATNLPILNDAERARVGTTYKQQGADAAERVGHRLVSGPVREQRIAAWCDYAIQHPDAWIFCWRGGQRSAIAQSWLTAAGHELPRVAGGFKALRQTCLTVLEETAGDPRPWLVVGGRTGSGKTDFLRATPNAIDLEGLAAHRGSAFGAMDREQPAPVSFENALAIACLQHRGPVLLLEDESRTIGRIALPTAWHARMQTAPVALLEVPIAERCANIVREYVQEPLARGTPEASLQMRYEHALLRIERRLGGERRRTITAALQAAFGARVANGESDPGAHAVWVGQLLEWYYDPMYDHQLNGKLPRVVVRGDAETLRDYLREGNAWNPSL